MKKRVLLAGEGGQGVQVMALVLSEALFDQGLNCVYMPSFGIEQRGGVSLAYVQAGDEVISSPRFRVFDLAVCMSDRAVERGKVFMQPGSVMVIDEELEDFAGRVVEQGRVLTIPVSRLLREELSPRVGNILFLGAVVKLLDMVNLENVKRALRRHFQYKFAASPELEELNFKALEMGMRLAH